jgi:hypothetical protein
VQRRHLKPEGARKCGLRKAEPLTQLGHVHLLGHCHRVAGQLYLTASVRQRFIEPGDQATA